MRRFDVGHNNHLCGWVGYLGKKRKWEAQSLLGLEYKLFKHKVEATQYLISGLEPFLLSRQKLSEEQGMMLQKTREFQKQQNERFKKRMVDAWRYQERVRWRKYMGERAWKELLKFRKLKRRKK